jgi:hypothetical protein
MRLKKILKWFLLVVGGIAGLALLDLMERVALGRFSHFTDREVDALHTYLQTLAATAGEPISLFEQMQLYLISPANSAGVAFSALATVSK